MKKLCSIFVFIMIVMFSACNKDSIAENVNTPDVLAEGGMITASARLQMVEEAAKKYSQYSRLTNISSSDVDIKGYSKKWHYEYHLVQNRTADSSLYFNSTVDAITFDSISTIRKTGNAVITHFWMNSDKAMQIVENNGGAEFRNKNSEYTIEAEIGEPTAAVPSTFWYITYKSKNGSARLNLIIDANSGAVSSK